MQNEINRTKQDVSFPFCLITVSHHQLFGTYFSLCSFVPLHTPYLMMLCRGGVSSNSGSHMPKTHPTADLSFPLQLLFPSFSLLSSFLSSPSSSSQSSSPPALCFSTPTLPPPQDRVLLHNPYWF